MNRFVVAKTATPAATITGHTPVVKSSGAPHAVALDNAVAQKVFTPIRPIPIILLKNPIPDISTKNGNLLNDRFDKNTLWFLPVFNLLADTDSDFSFIATQSTLPNQSGDPFYIADLKFTVNKDIPPEATSAKKSNAALNLKEIPLQALQVSLSIAYSDAQGHEAHTSFAGTIASTTNGNYEVHLSDIIGNAAILLFENLKITGSIQLAISATYTAWRPTGTSRMFFFKANMVANNFKPAIAAPSPNISTLRFKTLQPMRPPAPDTGFNENETFYQILGLDKKYNGNEYQLNYKIQTDTGSRPIIDVADLKNLNGNPTEFSELKIIDLSKYPSVNSLYIGVISRVIVIIPRSYTIVRNAITCSAACLASVDTTPSSAESCMFQFQFELTPAVDPVDFIALLKEIQQNSELQTYTLKFAGNLDDKSPSVINSIFTSDTSYEASATPQNFFLTTTIVDKPGQSAIVNANLFIQQLCNVIPGCGLGTMNLKLDDNFPKPVSTTVTLSLPNAKSDDGISWSISTDTQIVTLNNSTSFNFLLQRYTFCSDSGIGDATEVNIPIASGATATIPLPKNFNHLSIILDYVEQREGPVNRTDIARYMEIKTQDAQNVQYFIGIDSSQIKYTDRGIKQIDIQILLSTHPEITVPEFTVMNQNTAAGTKIMLPLQFAVSSLTATINFLISFSDTTKPSVTFTKQNDFIINPVFDLVDADIPGV